MGKINFKKLRIETQIGVFQEVDLTKDLGNIVFSGATKIEEDNLARAIHGSDEDGLNLSEQDCTMLINIAKNAGVKYSVISALQRAYNESKEAKTN
ncbi:MAG: hypothetical protein LBJ60_03005 [Tannerellaceae bacterium]|jgi:hypothetical protein|nr:hypothetical protein [Tannerellaceae bacterium]